MKMKMKMKMEMKIKIKIKMKMKMENHSIIHLISFLPSDHQTKTIVLKPSPRCRTSSLPPQRPRSRRLWLGEGISRRNKSKTVVKGTTIMKGEDLLSPQPSRKESWRSLTVSSTTEPIPITLLKDA